MFQDVCRGGPGNISDYKKMTFDFIMRADDDLFDNCLERVNMQRTGEERMRSGVIYHSDNHYSLENKYTQGRP